MGGGASVHRGKDNDEEGAGSAGRSSASGHSKPGPSTSTEKESKFPRFRLNRKKNKKDQPSSHPVSTMGKLERALKAAILIQRWYRQYLARMEVRRRYTWNIFQTIEYAGEQDQMKLYNFFNALLTHIPTNKMGVDDSAKDSAKDSVKDATSSSESTSTTGDTPNQTNSRGARVKLRKRKVFAGGSGPVVDLEEIPLENDYRGPHVKIPITLQNLQDLIDAFKKKKLLHVRYVASILRVAATNLKSRPNFNHPSTVLSKQITVCGDLHGKFDDLLVIFYKNGLPSVENPYVFNGDYVDRGKRSMEILLTLLACFLHSPDAVYLNRGNHEDHIMNMRYGFIREVRLKYKLFAGKILHLIDQVFRNLPLGTIIDSRVLVVHGGISESTDLHVIADIDRHKYVSILRPPVMETMDPDGHIIQLSDLYSSNNHRSEWRQVLDILWSDPQTGNGCSPNTFRGGGSYFGVDVTERVLKRHGLELLIRSHECKPDGYEFMHNNKCLTVFSASNYYEEGSNKGAYVRLLGGPEVPLEPYFVQFNAGTPKLRNMTIRQRVGLVEESALRELRTRIREREGQLLIIFRTYDDEASGLINVNDWCEAMEDGTELKLPWRMLRGRVADVDPKTGNVLYHTTFNSESGSNPEEDVTVADVLYRNKDNLEAIFRIIDKDNSGYISMEEFSEACDLLSEHLSTPIPQQQMMEMAKCMDINKDGRIDLNEFLESFRIVSADQEDLEEHESLDVEEEVDV